MVENTSFLTTHLCFYVAMVNKRKIHAVNDKIAAFFCFLWVLVRLTKRFTVVVGLDIK